MHALSPGTPVTDILLGDTIARFRLDEASQRVTLCLLPASLTGATVERRKLIDTPAHTGLPSKWPHVPAWKADSLVQLRLCGDGGPEGFALGRTQRNGPSVRDLRFEEQEIDHDSNGIRVRTHLRGERFSAIHHLSWDEGDPAVTVWTSLTNTHAATITVEMLSSFCLNDLTPFARDDAPGRLICHRFRSTWSSEGRHEARSLEELHLERSWTGHSHQSERFGQVGTLPVRGWFPFVALEDREAGVLWGAQLAWAGSWQMEVYRRHDDVNLSGGLADREFGHWWKVLAPGETLESPHAFLTTCAGDLDDLCHRLTAMQNKSLARLPAAEGDLPVIFNEWCSTWGSPTHAYTLETADRLAEAGVRIYVIDDGWAEKPGPGIQQNGDWIVDRAKFPDGLGATVAELRKKGLLAGLWFEFEVCNRGSKAWEKHADLHLASDGEPLNVGTRRFWDLRKPSAVAYLDEKVIAQLRDNVFSYLKVDYNETIGLGCDGAESPGEGLRQHVLAVQAFFRRLREEIPNLIIECCSSGGHRLEPSMLGLCAMGSFSDAHETLEIPIIAANLHRLILPRQNQIWAVLNAGDSRQRLIYSLAATFLGRMCLSGGVKDLPKESWELAKQSIAFYRHCVGVILSGKSRLHRDLGASYRYPAGWQIVLREDDDGTEALAVLHTFFPMGEASIRAPLPVGEWRIAQAFGDTAAAVRDGCLQVEANVAAFTGAAWLLRRV